MTTVDVATPKLVRANTRAGQEKIKKKNRRRIKCIMQDVWEVSPKLQAMLRVPIEQEIKMDPAGTHEWA